MAYINHLLFNNVFLKNLSPDEEEMAAARFLVHGSARDWFRSADLSTSAAMVETWIKPLLNQQSLDLAPAGLEDPRAWYIVAPWDRDNPLALCYIAPCDADLDGVTADKALPKGRHWMIKAVNQARRSEGQNLRWVVLTNGERWRLLDARSLRRYEAFLEVDLYLLLAGEDDPMAAYLFHRLLRLEGSLERDEQSGQNLLDLFLQQSIKATETTERYLKTSVSDNLNTPGGGDGIMAQLCMGLVRAIDRQGGKSFSDEERGAIYRDATYLLYRLLFVLYAEARGLLPMDRDDYRAVSLQRLIDEAEVLKQDSAKATAHPTILWDNLNALFGAIQHSDEYLGIPPYNGGLFDNKDKPYLQAVAMDNAFLAEGLVELAFLSDPKGERPAERIDYRDLSVRHLGSLYEGMIEYKLFIAEEELLARRTKDGQVKYLSAAKNERKPTDEVVAPGKVYFAHSPHERKATGTHYTVEELVERLVRRTVLCLLEEHWAAFQPRLNLWLREIEASPDEVTQERLRAYVDSQIEVFVHEQILTLRICDPAMGSGHFLVHVAYVITNFILQVLASTPWDNPAINLDAQYWRHQVVENCLYGVDINGMAVELAKLSLWLATMQPGRPLSFLDHHLKRGNSLLGVTLREIKAVLVNADLSKETKVTRLAETRGQYAIHEVAQMDQRLDQANDLLDHLARQRVAHAMDIALQEEDYERAEALMEPYKQIGDLLVARKMGLKISEINLRAIAGKIEVNRLESLNDSQRALMTLVGKTLEGQRTFHWRLEFPRLFQFSDVAQGDHGPHFDVMIGNPPFLGGSKISSELGDGYLKFIKETFSESAQNTDLCTYFFRRGHEHLSPNGYLGLVATNTIGEGDTREAGLEVLLRAGSVVCYADRYVTWPGEATIEVNLVALRRRSKTGGESAALLDGEKVVSISSWLDDLPEKKPALLVENQNQAFLGAVVHGTGFLLSIQEAEDLVIASPRNGDCLFPYLVGRDINNDPKNLASRRIINFHDWGLSRAGEYPELLEILRERVKPYRDQVKRKQYRENWWLYAEYYVKLRKIMARLNRVLIRSRVSELHMITFVDKEQVFGDATVVFAFDDLFHFALLQSSIHEIWLRRHASSLRTDIRYTPTDCFQTFPFPQTATQTTVRAAEKAGEAYYDHRQQFMVANQLGLTNTYNRFHDPSCHDPAIAEMRRLHAVMDEAVLACYGWGYIDLEHGFYLNDRKKTRFAPSRAAQREIFTRLMELNQEVAASEKAAGLAPNESTVDDGEASGEDNA